LRRGALYGVAGIACLIAAVALAARFMPVTNHVVLALAAWSPYLMIIGGGVSAVVLLTRRWWTASAALSLVAVAVAVGTAVVHRRVVDAHHNAAGVGIWSRYQIVRSSRIPGYALGAVSADILVPDAAGDVIVVTTHLVGPWPQPIDGWRHEIAKFSDTFSDTMESVAASAGTAAVIVA